MITCVVSRPAKAGTWNYGDSKDAIAARDAAYKIAYILTAGSPESSLEVRFVTEGRSDPVIQRRVWTWVVAFALAFVLGAAWEMIYRSSL